MSGYKIVYQRILSEKYKHHIEFESNNYFLFIVRVHEYMCIAPNAIIDFVTPKIMLRTNFRQPGLLFSIL